MEKKNKREGNNGKNRLFFACRSVNYTDGFFFNQWKKKKETGAVGMKVNNMHEFVKKINNAAFVG